MPRTEQPNWEDYRKMIAGRAWHFAKKYGVDGHELIGEGNLVFVKACRTYKPKRAKFSTYLYRCLTTELNKFCRQERRRGGYLLSADDTTPDGISNHHVNIKTAIHLQQSFACLPGSGTQAVRLLQTAPHELGLTMAEPPRRVKAALRDHLRECGDSWSVVQSTLGALKQLHAEVC